MESSTEFLLHREERMPLGKDCIGKIITDTSPIIICDNDSIFKGIRMVDSYDLKNERYMFRASNELELLNLLSTNFRIHSQNIDMNEGSSIQFDNDIFEIIQVANIDDHYVLTLARDPEETMVHLPVKKGKSTHFANKVITLYQESLDQQPTLLVSSIDLKDDLKDTHVEHFEAPRLDSTEAVVRKMKDIFPWFEVHDLWEVDDNKNYNLYINELLIEMDRDGLCEIDRERFRKLYGHSRSRELSTLTPNNFEKLYLAACDYATLVNFVESLSQDDLVVSSEERKLKAFSFLADLEFSTLEKLESVFQLEEKLFGKSDYKKAFAVSRDRFKYDTNDGALGYCNTSHIRSTKKNIVILNTAQLSDFSTDQIGQILAHERKHISDIPNNEFEEIFTECYGVLFPLYLNNREIDFSKLYDCKYRYPTIQIGDEIRLEPKPGGAVKLLGMLMELVELTDDTKDFTIDEVYSAFIATSHAKQLRGEFFYGKNNKKCIGFAELWEQRLQKEKGSFEKELMGCKNEDYAKVDSRYKQPLDKVEKKNYEEGRKHIEPLEIALNNYIIQKYDNAKTKM